MATLIVGMLLGWAVSALVRVGVRNHRRVVTAPVLDGLALRSLLLGALCLAVATWVVGTILFSYLAGTTP